MYRFLLTPRWIGLGLLACLLAATMVGLGRWQLHRYHERSTINSQIDAAGSTDAMPLDAAMRPPVATDPHLVGPPPEPSMMWLRVRASGHYDPAHEILARVRTVNGAVGFEVLTPLVVGRDTAVLVDRGWLPAGNGGSTTPPKVPPAPTGPVTVVGRVHGPESGAGPAQPFANTLAVRRIAPAQLATVVPYWLYGGYLTLESQTPAADPAFVAIPVDYQNAAMNASYTVQWLLMAAMVLVGYGYLAYRERQIRSGLIATEPLPVDLGRIRVV